MPQSSRLSRPERTPNSKTSTTGAARSASRHTVALAPVLARQVEKYAKESDTSMSKAIAALVRIGLDGQEQRKREFFKRLKANLANDDPKQEDQLVDEFRALILGR